MLDFDLMEENVDEELKINDESIFLLANELKIHARKEAKYHRLASAANKAVSDKTLELKVLTATIIKEIMDRAVSVGKPVPPSTIGELRKSVIAGDPRFQATSKSLNEAWEEANYLNGLVSSWVSRGFRLQELIKIADRMLVPEPRIYSDKFKSVDANINKMEATLEG